MQKNVKFIGSQTKLPMSVVLYMSETELIERLRIMRERLDFDYCYIFHKGEKGGKNHIHLLLRSNSANGFTNVQKIRNDYLYSFAEIDTELYKQGEKVPSKPFVESKNLSTWGLYHIHNAEYLSSIGESREFEYTVQDLRGCPSLISEIQDNISNNGHKSRENASEIIYNGIRVGLSDFQILQQFENVPVESMYSVLKGIKEFRKTVQVDTDEWQHVFQTVAPYVMQKIEEENPQLLHNVELVYKQTKIAHWKIAQSIIDYAIKNAMCSDVLDLILNS